MILLSSSSRKSIPLRNGAEEDEGVLMRLRRMAGSVGAAGKEDNTGSDISISTGMSSCGTANVLEQPDALGHEGPSAKAAKKEDEDEAENVGSVGTAVDRGAVEEEELGKGADAVMADDDEDEEEEEEAEKKEDEEDADVVGGGSTSSITTTAVSTKSTMTQSSGGATADEEPAVECTTRDGVVPTDSPTVQLNSNSTARLPGCWELFHVGAPSQMRSPCTSLCDACNLNASLTKAPLTCT